MTPAQDHLYELLMVAPVAHGNLMMRSDGIGSAFRRGYFHPAGRCPYVRTSLAEAAWRAGRDRRRACNRAKIGLRRSKIETV